MGVSAHPSTHPIRGGGGLDWAPKPVRPGWGSRMAKEGGEPSLAWAPRGSRPVGGASPHSSALPQGAGHLLTSTGPSVCAVWDTAAVPCRVGSGRVKCVPGTVGNRVPALRSPALPSGPWAPVGTRQGQLGEPGELGASSSQGVWALCICLHTLAPCQITGPGRSLSPLPQPAPRSRSVTGAFL